MNPATSVLKSAIMQQRTSTSPLVAARVAIALVLPVVASILAFIILPMPAGQSLIVLPLAVLAIVSWFLGWRWYELKELGLRGQRPLYAGIGFAALIWLVFLLVRFFTVTIEFIRADGTGQAFVYLLLFEAFALQLWCFGLVFRTVAAWRGALTAAVVAGLLFGVVAFLVFQESFSASASSFLYFAVWGILYGVIRLRTGSLLGIVPVQAMQSLTAWHILSPLQPPANPFFVNQLQNLYLVAVLFYMILIWRLWPKEEGDYRV
jgi:hypothetical protein